MRVTVIDQNILKTQDEMLNVDAVFWPKNCSRSGSKVDLLLFSFSSFNAISLRILLVRVKSNNEVYDLNYAISCCGLSC